MAALRETGPLPPTIFSQLPSAGGMGPQPVRRGGHPSVAAATGRGDGGGGPLDPTSYGVGYILSPRHVGADLINKLLTRDTSLDKIKSYGSGA